MAERDVRAWWRQLAAAGLGVLFALTLALAGASPASAHAGIETTTPENRSVVADFPTEVKLRFNEPVGTGLGSVRVLNPEGERVDLGQISSADGGREVIVPLGPNNKTGTHLVSWRVTSVDSHPITGGFFYSVGEPSAGPATGDDALGGQNVATNRVLQAIKLVGFIGITLFVGGLVFLVFLWPAGLARSRPLRLVEFGRAVALIASIAGLFVQGPYAAGLGLSSIGQAKLLVQVLETQIGQAYLLRSGALLVSAVFFLIYQRQVSRGRPARGVLAGLLMSTAAAILGWSWGGHAGVLGPDWVLVDALHLISVSVWLGGLAMLAFCLLRAPEDELAGVATRWSTLAATSVVTLVVTGTLSTLRDLEAWDALWSTTYGKLVLFKIVLLGVMLTLANAGRLWIRRRYGAGATAAGAVEVDSGADALSVAAKSTSKSTGTSTSTSTGTSTGASNDGAANDDEPDRPVSQLRAGVLGEIAVAAVVLTVTAVLVGTVPMSQAYAPPYTLTQDLRTSDLPAGRLQTDLEPARTGINALHVYVTDDVGRPVDVPEITGRISNPDGGVGPTDVGLARVTPGHFETLELVLPVSGSWRLTLNVRTSDIVVASVNSDIRVR